MSYDTNRKAWSAPSDFKSVEILWLQFCSRCMQKDFILIQLTNSKIVSRETGTKSTLECDLIYLKV